MIEPRHLDADSRRETKEGSAEKCHDSKGDPGQSPRRSDAPVIPHSEPAGGTGSLEAAMMQEKNPVKRFFKVLGPGLITGASDDDPSGIGTYAVAGASLVSQLSGPRSSPFL